MSTNIPANTGLSEDAKTIIVILLLIFVYPVGMVLMFAWMKWPVWVKLLVGFPVTLIFIALVLVMIGGFMAAFSPDEQIDKAKDAMIRNNAASVQLEVMKYYAENSTYPWGKKLGYRSEDATKEAWFSKVVKRSPDLKNVESKISIEQTEDGLVTCYYSVVEKEEVCLD